MRTAVIIKITMLKGDKNINRSLFDPINAYFIFPSATYVYVPNIEIGTTSVFLTQLVLPWPGVGGGGPVTHIQNDFGSRRRQVLYILSLD